MKNYLDPFDILHATKESPMRVHTWSAWYEGSGRFVFLTTSKASSETPRLQVLEPIEDGTFVLYNSTTEAKATFVPAAKTKWLNNNGLTGMIRENPNGIRQYRFVNLATSGHEGAFQIVKTDGKVKKMLDEDGGTFERLAPMPGNCCYDFGYDVEIAGATWFIDNRGYIHTLLPWHKLPKKVK